MLPKDFPPFITVQYYFYGMRDCGLLDVINETLVNTSRLVTVREAEPTAASIDSQSVKICESGGISGFSAGKKIKGRKRHIITDTQGNLLYSTVHSADIQDRDGAVEVINATCQAWPTISHLFADGSYTGWNLQLALLQTMDKSPAIEITRRPDWPASLKVIQCLR
jgi:transposase